MQLADENFSVISLRKGTISGYSPRMRFDLIINTMFKNAMRDHVITVNNPSIWRPILSIEDAATAYIRAVEANHEISGIFNIASGNYTVGEVADLVKRSGRGTSSTAPHQPQHQAHARFPQLQSQHRKGGQNVLSFHPTGDVKSIVET